MRASFILLGMMTAGCASMRFEEREWASLPTDERQHALDVVTSKCGLPNDRVKMLGGENVEVRPNAYDRYEAVDCMLEGLKSLRGIQMGFIGNEAFIPNDKDK